MVNDVDYTRISAVALHDWSAARLLGRIGCGAFLPRKQSQRTIPVVRGFYARHLRDHRSQGQNRGTQGQHRVGRPFRDPSSRSRAARDSRQCPSGATREPDRDNTRREACVKRSAPLVKERRWLKNVGCDDREPQQGPRRRTGRKHERAHDPQSDCVERRGRFRV